MSTVSLPVNLTTNTGKVRLLIPDRGSALPDGTHYFFYSDDEINAFLSIEGGAVRLAAALAIETIASDTAMVDKVIETLDLKTDGAKTSDALLKRAQMLRDQYETCDLDAFGITSFGDLSLGNFIEYAHKEGDFEIC